MSKILFGSFFKILTWLFIIAFVVIGFSEPGFLVVAGVLLLAGPGVAVPALFAVRGKKVESARSMSQTKGLVEATFASRKAGRQWTQTSHGPSQLDFQLTSAKTGCEPTVSVHLEDSGTGSVFVAVWMSEWTSGGLNGGKGTPFWVWGGVRALNKVNEVAKTLATAPVSGDPVNLPDHR